jgi:hypothetical protein
MSFDPRQPYNDLPFLPPPCELETKRVLKKCVAANRALAELKGAGDLIPNQAVLINAIPLQEAKLSSEIVSIPSTYRRDVSTNPAGIDTWLKPVPAMDISPMQGAAAIATNLKELGYGA